MRRMEASTSARTPCVPRIRRESNARIRRVSCTHPPCRKARIQGAHACNAQQKHSPTHRRSTHPTRIKSTRQRVASTHLSRYSACPLHIACLLFRSPIRAAHSIQTDFLSTTSKKRKRDNTKYRKGGHRLTWMACRPASALDSRISTSLSVCHKFGRHLSASAIRQVRQQESDKERCEHREHVCVRERENTVETESCQHREDMRDSESERERRRCEKRRTSTLRKWRLGPKSASCSCTACMQAWRVAWHDCSAEGSSWRKRLRCRGRERLRD